LEFTGPPCKKRNQWWSQKGIDVFGDYCKKVTLDQSTKSHEKVNIASYRASKADDRNEHGGGKEKKERGDKNAT
jgi:hypothetical protein